ncbi:hypothetical protein SEA_SUCCESS_72 [Streptomyces phage Success]|uniref:Uncharacterized protein n=1 Tax=Streptomyces phage Success TaxID=2999013 RepID=A0A9E8S1X2_9CAUD|nr:hypothetical protein QEH47_gp60 [Streptomyces phage Success]WAB08851.1 hypothetical protein SEA_SUCCESS_72 [Streptomyces phage Success]
MSDFPWPNLDSPEIVCGTFTYPEDAEDTVHRLAKLVKASGKTKQYGVFVEEYGNIFRVVVRDRLATEKVKQVRREKRAAKRARQEDALCVAA